MNNGKLTVRSADVKTLNACINEPNPFKRYVLAQLWISQIYTNSLTSPIATRMSSIKSGGTIDPETIYNTFRDIKNEISTYNDHLLQVITEAENTLRITKVMNEILELGINIQDMDNNLDKLSEQYNLNAEYIEKINNLSESKIQELISHDKNSKSE